MGHLDQKIDQLPDTSGVYLFKDRKGAILYIGKAGNIRHRASSYFQRLSEKDMKTQVMLEKVADIETMVTDTEKEAFILENHLIKAHHPRYNIKLRDDKNYPCLRLSIEEKFPTLSIVRQIKKDRSLYFGPYPSATSLKETLKLIRRLFPIRTCRHTKFFNRLRPCINYEMNRCFGPCCDKIDPIQYQEVVNQARMFLEGKNKDLLGRLKKKMEEESGKLHFEIAAKIRDQIEHIEHVVERQKVVSRDFLDQDVMGFHRQDHTIIVHPLFIRAGKLIGGKGFTFPSTGLPDEEILYAFLRQYYHKGKFIPEQILIPKKIPERPFLEQWLSELKGKKVRILVPTRGNKKHLLQMARENAQKTHLRETEIERDQKKFFETVRERLHLRKPPYRIEAFDISNLQGGHAVGSMICFKKGEPSKERYRHFRIKTIEGADDCGMMYEVLLRRYQKAIEENDLPDLVLLDGGRGQLNVAQEVFRELNIREVDLLSLAKKRTMEGLRFSQAEKGEEKIFHPHIKAPLTLGRHSSILNFLDRIRDEAHRFAITYHKKVRSKETIQSELEGIPGIGRVRNRELLKIFGSVDQIRKATMDNLIKAPRMTPKIARAIYHFFHPDSK
jgi:excinuclease ABC subunit C